MHRQDTAREHDQCGWCGRGNATTGATRQRREQRGSSKKSRGEKNTTQSMRRPRKQHSPCAVSVNAIPRDCLFPRAITNVRNDGETDVADPGGLTSSVHSGDNGPDLGAATGVRAATATILCGKFPDKSTKSIVLPHLPISAITSACVMDSVCRPLIEAITSESRMPCCAATPSDTTLKIAPGLGLMSAVLTMLIPNGALPSR